MAKKEPIKSFKDLKTSEAFTGLKGLLEQASKASRSNGQAAKDERQKLITDIKNKANKKLKRAKNVQAETAAPEVPVAPKMSKAEIVAQEKEAIKTGMYAREATMILDEDLQGAIKSLDQRSKDGEGNIQTITARNVLINCVRPEVDKSVRKRLQRHALEVLLNKPGSAIEQELSDIQAYNNFDLGGTSKPGKDDDASLRMRLAKIDQCIDSDDLVGACEIVSDLIGGGEVKPAARKILAKLFNSIRSRIQKDVENPDDALLRTTQAKVEERSEWKSLTGDVALAVLTFEENEENNLDLSKLVVNLPITLYSSRIIDGVPLLIDMEGHVRSKQIRKYNLRHIVNTVSTFVGRLVGVPNINDPEAEYAKAKKYAFKKEGIVLQNTPLRRPDSDAVWFPIIPFEDVYVRNVGFPDMLGSREHRTSEEYRVAVMKTNSIKQRSFREAFEQSENSHFALLTEYNRKLTDAQAIIARCGEELKEAFGRTDISESAIIKRYDEKIAYDVNGEMNMIKRWNIIQMHRAQQTKFLTIHQTKVSAQTEASRLRALVRSIDQEIAARKQKAFPDTARRLLGTPTSQ